MNIAAFDLGTNTGWASLHNGVLSWGSEVFPRRRDESPGVRYIRFDQWLSRVFFGKPSMIMHERIDFYRGGAPTEVLLGFVTHLQSWCAKREVEITSVHNGTLKKFATGKGNASKASMRVHAGEYLCNAEKVSGIKVFMQQGQTLNLTEDEADAINLLRYGMAQYGGFNV